MRKWKNELEQNFIKTEIRNIDDNMLDNALIVVSNLIARASTKWSLKETKLFMCSLSRIKTRDDKCWITLSKRDVCNKLDIDKFNRSKLREDFRKMMTKSYIQIDSKNSDDFHDGFLITEVKSDKNNVFVRFNDTYLPLLDRLTSHFTEFYLEAIKDFTSIHSYNLYIFLCSWYDNNYLIQNKKIKKSELNKIFNLKDSDYWRNFGTDRAKFDFADFEKRVLNVAINEINSLCKEHKCDMFIESCTKVKDGHFVLGYDIHYSFIGEDGCRL